MVAADLTQELRVFFDAFVAAFQRFNGEVIAARYTAPYLALQADGSLRHFPEATDLAHYFQDVVNAYHAQGCRSCRYRDLEVQALGRACALATVTWELLGDDGTLLTAWRESYNLRREPAGWRIFASMDHA